MPLDAYTTGYTCQQITEQCERLSDSPGLNLYPPTKVAPANITELRATPAYQWLDLILRNIYQLNDWPFTKKAGTMTLSTNARSVSPPADFWRLQFDSAIWIIESDRRTQLRQLEREQFFGDLTNQNSKGRPRNFYIDRQKVASIFFDPIPDATYFAEIHYFCTFPQILDKAEIPVFPFHDYLVAALLVSYYMDQDDSRVVAAEQQRAKLWKEIRNSAFDHRETSGFTQLDGNYFRSMPLRYE